MKYPFKKKESFKHKCAVEILSSWVNGTIEEPFYVDDMFLFVPDVTVRENGILKSIYEVVNCHPLNGNKLGLIQEWCYRNATELSIFEVSADYILAQTDKPERIEIMEYYDVDLN